MSDNERQDENGSNAKPSVPLLEQQQDVQVQPQTSHAMNVETKPVPEVSSRVNKLADNLQGCNLQAPPSSNFDEKLEEVRDCYDLIEGCTTTSIHLVQRLQESFMTWDMSSWTTRQQITFTRELSRVTSALQTKQAQFVVEQPVIVMQTEQENPATGPQDVEMLPTQYVPPPVRVSQVVQFHHLHQFMSDMAQNIVRSATQRLSQEAMTQLNYYNDYGVRIDVQKFKCNPLKELFSFKGDAFIQRSQLKKSQCEFLQRRISSEGAKVNTSLLDFPAFNPDFHFSWTILFFEIKDEFIWREFVGDHRLSQLTLPQNKGFTELQIKAKFAFTQGCRYLRVIPDFRLNTNINERESFIISNGFTPIQAQRINKSCSRCLIPRCKDTGASRQELYIYSDDEAAFIRAYTRWYHISPILKFGNFSLDILNAKALPTLPSDIPPPWEYEQIIPLHSAWLSLTETQLVTHLQKKFCPCLGFGGLYLPKYSHSSYCVTGKVINMTPRFYNTVDTNDFDKYFQWSLADGKWIPFIGVITSAPNYQQYTSLYVSSEQDQLQTFKDNLEYENQMFDPLTQPVYGSMHFWTWYGRDSPSTQISSTPMSIYSKCSQGFQPFKPALADDPLVLHLLQSQNQLQPQDKEQQFQEFICQQSITCTEVAIRYRRTQTIKGYNSSFLSWNNNAPNSSFLRSRIPLPLELLQIPLNAEQLKAFKNFDLQQFEWVPKALIGNIDEETDSYYTHKRDLTKVRFNRLSTNNQRFQVVSNKKQKIR